MDSRTVYIGHKEPPPGAEAYIPQRYPDNRIVSSKVREPRLISRCLPAMFTILLLFGFMFRPPRDVFDHMFLRMTLFFFSSLFSSCMIIILLLLLLLSPAVYLLELHPQEFV